MGAKFRPHSVIKTEIWVCHPASLKAFCPQNINFGAKMVFLVSATCQRGRRINILGFKGCSCPPEAQEEQRLLNFWVFPSPATTKPGRETAASPLNQTPRIQSPPRSKINPPRAVPKVSVLGVEQSSSTLLLTLQFPNKIWNLGLSWVLPAAGSFFCPFFGEFFLLLTSQRPYLKRFSPLKSSN